MGLVFCSVVCCAHSQPAIVDTFLAPILKLTSQSAETSYTDIQAGPHFVIRSFHILMQITGFGSVFFILTFTNKGRRTEVSVISCVQGLS